MFKVVLMLLMAAQPALRFVCIDGPSRPFVTDGGQAGSFVMLGK